ncbi:GNAT family N-acetyltransferase [Thermoanaerobacterium sp. RBIITD]|uniref:GNAT family N-acetyltransferase n=1 Tax=Thermoanaerobacterium sp. RBIITD TaxID=1550240 RepID=UPI000BB8D8B5|nr:GNAT family N-acetyltransferase [Thermoanaerobacterium sp. RBIITD]SNX54932.1 Ribosomal protein S18 acetylase RimI [Thermoanaerobacterium sp. RBIITD]
MKEIEYIDTKLNNFKIRYAQENDVSIILEFIKELASYEKLNDQVVATEDILKRSLFDRKVAEVLIGEYDCKPVCYAIFFYNFSTFTGKPGIYLEDIYVKPEYRNKGIGKIILTYIAKLATDRDCSRFEWACLDWNEPSINFYKSLGAVPMDEWTVYRLEGDSIKKLAEKF